ncbi:MAG: hypothetical protein KDD36_09700 [Flavobacteriales bacterium]|nr:hypothetical protein [Flavobacteriales bacterium]
MEKMIAQLKATKGKGPFVSIVFPTDKQYPDSRQNEIRLKNAIKLAEQDLAGKTSPEVFERLKKKLEADVQKVDLVHVREGIGIYFSEKAFDVVVFPLPVREKVTVGKAFDLDALELNIQARQDYWVLCLSKGKSRLLRGNNDGLKEIEDEVFPMPFENEFEVGKARPAKPGEFYVKEESKIDLERLDSYLRKVDHALGERLKTEDLPVVVMSVERELAEFRKVSKHRPSLLHGIAGNYDRHSPDELAKLVWPVMKG